MIKHWGLALLVAAILTKVHGQEYDTPNSSPHGYPGQPRGDFSPEWQKYFQVTDSLPFVKFDPGSSFAGNIPVQRTQNTTLFFWGFEKERGSLAATANERGSEPWAIWLNGGRAGGSPGASGLLGLLFENGPIQIQDVNTTSPNNFSWNRLSDFIWVDSPVGTGYSTSDTTGYVDNEDQMAADFFGFLGNLVKVFPSLATRPLYLVGESYAGVYIPYIAKAYFGLQNSPVKLTKIAIGNGAIADIAVYRLAPVLNIIETYPQIIGYDPAVYKYFQEQLHLCNYDINLTYPQNGPIPPLTLSYAYSPSDPNSQFYGPDPRQFPPPEQYDPDMHYKRNLLEELESRYSTLLASHNGDVAKARWKRDLSQRVNGSTDPWYKCDLWQLMIDYTRNYTFPWTLNETDQGFNYFDIPELKVPQSRWDADFFLNDNRTRAALHAPTDKNWVDRIPPFAQMSRLIYSSSEQEYTSGPPMEFLSELATNASTYGVSVVLYSGNNDGFAAHRGTEIAIQNTTFGGIQGFTRPPSTPWHDDAGNFAGIVHQERNWTYVLFDNAGHLVPSSKPAAAYTFFREFVLGNNATGLVDSSGNVQGGEDAKLMKAVLPGQREIRYNRGTVPLTYTPPSESVVAWQSFIQTAAPPEPTPGSTPGPTPKHSADQKLHATSSFVYFPLLLLFLLLWP